MQDLFEADHERTVPVVDKPSYDPSTDELLQIGNGTSVAVGALRGARKAQCDFWDAFG